jgi:hypothetical protein
VEKHLVAAMTHAMRRPPGDPTLADFERALRFACACAIVSDTAMSQEG